MLQTHPNANVWRISRKTGEFLDQDTELLYFEEEIHSAFGQLRLITTVLGLLFLSFAIPDWFVLQSRETFYIVLALRVLFFFFMLFLGQRLRGFISARMFCRWITIAELFSVSLFIATFLLYDAANFLIQAFGVMLLLSSFYLVPNRFANQFMISLVTIAAFLNSAWIFLPGIPPMQMMAVAIYLILIVWISSIAYVRTSFYKRRQYVNNQRLRQLSITDPLTRVFNRQKFNEELWREISRSNRTQSPLAVILMDFDDFKAINDRYGHLQGDRVLVETASLIRKEIRITDVFARWGGEEFILLLPATGLPHAFELAERLKHTINSLCLESGILIPYDAEVGEDENKDAPSGAQERLPVSCSFGIALMRSSDTPDTLIQRADQMLYSAKMAGKDRIISE
ncbi:MAG TPA: GGDEF domain-containing protein [Clostridia bacterium]